MLRKARTEFSPAARHAQKRASNRPENVVHVKKLSRRQCAANFEQPD